MIAPMLLTCSLPAAAPGDWVAELTARAGQEMQVAAVAF